MTDKFSIKKIPQRMGISNSLWIIIANTAMIPPMVKLPVSPINTWAGKALYQRKPISAPIKAQIKITSSSLPGIYMILRYPAYSMWLDTYANMPKVRPMIAEFPAAIPSMPSFKLAPFETAVTTKMVTKTNNIHPAVWAWSPRKPTKSA